MSLTVTVPLPAKFHLSDLHKHLSSQLNIPNFSGVATDEDTLVLVFDSNTLFSEEVDRILPALQSYVYVPNWNQVRKQRARLFLDLDSRVTAALRKIRLSEGRGGQEVAAARAELRVLDDYAQLLADVTKQPDPDNVQWPTPPWQGV